jgi:hypothetical protein
MLVSAFLRPRPFTSLKDGSVEKKKAPDSPDVNLLRQDKEKKDIDPSREKKEEKKKKNKITFSVKVTRFLATPTYKVVFNYLRYLGMCYSSSVRNDCLFDRFSGVSQYICMIKRKLIR